MRCLALIVIVILGGVVAAANHNCPNVGTQQSWVLGIHAYEFDQDVVWQYAVEQAYTNVGYPCVTTENSYANLVGPMPTACPWWVTDTHYDVCHSDPRVEVYTEWGHANPLCKTHELYSHDANGLATRNERWDYIKEYYDTSGDDSEIMKTEKADTIPPLCYHGIGITPDFYLNKFGENGGLPDFMNPIGCSMNNDNWARLLGVDRARVLVVLTGGKLRSSMYWHHTGWDSVKVPWEACIPYWRMSGRSSDEPEYGNDIWENEGVRLVRTVPNAFRCPANVGGGDDLLYRGGQYTYTVKKVWGLDSMALSPMLIETNLQEWDELPEYDNNECAGTNASYYAAFSCPMYAEHPAWRVSGYWGCWAGCESILWYNGIVDSKIQFRAGSVAASPGRIIFRATQESMPSLRSAEGNHPFWKPDLGPAGTNWEPNVLCLYDSPNYAAAYGPCPAWKDGSNTMVWLSGTERETRRHDIRAGPTPNDLRVVASVPGHGGRHIVRDELITLAGNYDFVQIVERPSGCTSNLSPVRPATPADLAAWNFKIPEYSQVPQIDSPRWELPPDCPDFVFWCGTQGFMDIIQAETEFEQILNDNNLPDVTYVLAPGPEGEHVRDYLRDCRSTYGRCPWMCLVGSGCEEPDYWHNIISPHMEPDCATCFFRDYQTGDAQWGELDDDYLTDGWKPDATITRIGCWDGDMLRRYSAVAESYHAQVMGQQMPSRVLAILGDESEGDIDPALVNQYWEEILCPAMNDGWGYVVDELRDSDFEHYYDAHPVLVAKLNGQDERPAVIYWWGVWSSMFRSPGALWYAYDGLEPWDGTLLEPGDNHYVVTAPICGGGGIFRYSAWRPSLLEMGMFQVGNDQFPSENTPGAAAIRANTSGGTEHQHRVYAEHDAYYSQHSLTTMYAHEKCLESWAILYPEDYHYGQGMIHLGLPMRYPHSVTSADEMIRGNELAVLRCQSPVYDVATIRFSLPPLPGEARVEIRVFGADGRLADRLAIDPETCHGTACWRPVTAAAGVYFVDLVVNGHSFASGRTILLR